MVFGLHCYEPMVRGVLILLSMGLFTGAAFAERVRTPVSPSQPTYLDETFRPTQPTAEDNISHDAVNAEFRVARACRIYPDDSWSVMGGMIKSGGLTQVIPKTSRDFEENGRSLLAGCHAVSSALGPEAYCDSLELAGHANGFSIGMGKTFGLRWIENRWERFPHNDELFREIVKCLQSITGKQTKIIFTTCGAATSEGVPVPELAGKKLFYPLKDQAQQYFSDILNRPMISPLGGVSSIDNGVGAYSKMGWHFTEPSPLANRYQFLTPHSLAEALPVPSRTHGPHPSQLASKP